MKAKTRGPFLESPDNFSGPELYFFFFVIRIRKMRMYFLVVKPARLV